jgi:hypothetical protein
MGNTKVEKRAINIVKNRMKSKFIIGDVSQKHIGMDLILIPKNDLTKAILVEVKGTSQNEPVAFRLYKSFKKMVKLPNYSVYFVCGLGKSKKTKLYKIPSEYILKWAKKSSQKNCYSITGIKEKLKTSGIKPVF